MNNENSADAVIKIARKIANCDFQVTVSRYVTGPNYPWTITVGESRWHRHLVVKNIGDDGEDAEFALLDHEGPAIDLFTQTPQIERTITLRELIAHSYTGVKELLQLAAQAA